MASIVSRGNEKYTVVYYEGKGASKHQVWKSGFSLKEAIKFKGQKDLEAKQERESAAAQKQKASVEKEITLEEYMGNFVKSYGRKRWGASYYSNNIALLNNYIFPYLGHYELVSITTKNIDDYYSRLLTECSPVNNSKKLSGKNVSAAQIKGISKLLKTAFNQAIRWNLINSNPIGHASAPEHKPIERPTFSPSEFEKILEYTDRPDDYEKYVIHVALCIQYYCTTRGGEVGALQWIDYNRNYKTLHVHKTISCVKREHLSLPKLKIYYTFPSISTSARTAIILKSPKTAASERFCKINSILIEKLDRLKAMQQDLIKNVFGNYYPDSNLIICQPNGRPLMPEQLNRKFKEIIQNMHNEGTEFNSVPLNQLDSVVFHSVRASSATKKLAVSGGNIKAVMTAGGWAEPDMVIRYSKTYDEDQSMIVQQMEDDYLQTRRKEQDITWDNERILQILAEHPELILK